MAGEAERAQGAPRADCTSCRVTGTGVCAAISAYLLASNYAAPAASPIQRHMTLVMAGGFAAMAVARAMITNQDGL